MSDFNYKEYLRNNPLLKEEVKEDKLITEEKKELPKSIKDKEKMDAEIEAKKAKGMMDEGGHLPSEKKDKKKNNMALASMDDIEIDEDAYEKAQMSALGIDGFQNFYQRYEQPLHNFRKIKKSDVQQDEIITEHTFVIEQSDDFNE